MNVILFGSAFSPLSAVAASFLNEKKVLKLIVIAKGLPKIQGGLICFASKVCIGFCRYFHIFLRAIRIKRSKSYLSLLEFIKDNPNIPKVYFTPKMFNLERIIRSKLNDEELDRYTILSCIFPFKIPNNLLNVERAINMHPGELPANRGPNPYFWVLANNMPTSGITYHILTPQIDRGPILFREAFPINSDFSEYKIEKITAGYLKRSLPLLFERLQEFWSNAKTQSDGVYYPHPSFNDRKKYQRLSVFHIRDFFCR